MVVQGNIEFATCTNKIILENISELYKDEYRKKSDKSELYEDACDVYICNTCDTESCNSWGITSMPDKDLYEEEVETAGMPFWMLMIIAVVAFFAIAFIVKYACPAVASSICTFFLCC